MELAHLHRTWYKVPDYIEPGTSTEDPAGVEGAWSASIPARMADKIVAVDWSTPGEVEVTFLLTGPPPGGH